MTDTAEHAKTLVKEEIATVRSYIQNCEHLSSLMAGGSENIDAIKTVSEATYKLAQNLQTARNERDQMYDHEAWTLLTQSDPELDALASQSRELLDQARVVTLENDTTLKALLAQATQRWQALERAARPDHTYDAQGQTKSVDSRVLSVA